MPFKSEKQLELGELDSKNRATGAHIQLKDSDEPTEKRDSKLTYDPVGWHNYKFFYGDGREEAWLMSRGHLIGYQFSGLNDEKRNLVPMTNWLNAGNYSGTDEHNQSSILYYENRLDSWLANHPNYYLDYKVTPIYQNDELIPRQIGLQYVGIDENGKLLEIKLESSKEKVDKYSVTHVVLDNVSANAEINYLDGTAKNLVEDAKVKEEKEKAKKEAEEKAEAEKKAKEEEEKARQAEQEKEESQESNTQSANSGGYFKDSRGRWHKPNGKYASKKEIKAAGLTW
ncbi:DNA/RNA non-specific endonuclease family protein [Streptococcus mitis SK321]|nr:DNA/RNA non-specific endonuclease family protein [Streptococcus mitis SK321]